MTAALALLAVAAAVTAWPTRVLPAERLASLAPRPGQPRDAATGVRRGVAATAVLSIALVAVTGLPWWAPVVLTVAVVVAGRRRPRAGPASGEVALLADLLASCIASGAGIADAVEAAAEGAGPWLQPRAVEVARQLRRGAPVTQAWRDWLADERLAPVARPCVRAAGSGSAVAAELRRVAARLRSRRRVEVQQRMASASVWVVLPLGLCFLPAFVLVGVVPVAVGLLHRL